MPTPPTISVAGYDRSRASVADCAVVKEGPVACCGALCPNAAIAQTAVSAYMSEFAKQTYIACRQLTIGCRDGGALLPDGCQQGRVACQGGACALDLPGDGAAGD